MKNNSKRIAAAVLAFCITAGTLPAIEHSTVFPTAYAVEEEGTLVEKNGMLYIEYADHISLIYCEPDGDTLYIPDMIDGKPVTEITNYAFIEVDYYEYFETPALPESVKRVVIPESIERIGRYAFCDAYDQSGLEEVIFPETLKEIGDYAFSENSKLNVYGLSENTVLDPGAFRRTRYDVYERANYFQKNGMFYKEYSDHIKLYYCEPDGDTLYIPDMIDGKPVTEIADYAFNAGKHDGYNIPEIPDSVKRIIIPESVEKIGEYSFYHFIGSEGIKEVFLPETLKEISKEAFSGNKELNVYGLSENTVVSSDAFDETRYNVAERANYIQKDNMVYTEYNDHIELAYCEPDGEVLMIPDMINGKPVTEIADDAFYYRYYHDIEVPELPDSVKRVVIPASVERIGEYAFYDSNLPMELEEVILPETLKEIGDYAFCRNSKLNVYGLSENTILGEYAFDYTRYDVAARVNYVHKENMMYIEYEDHISLIYCEPDGEEIMIPEMVEGKPVTEIADHAFIGTYEKEQYDCYGLDIPSLPENVSKIIIPEGVEVIGEEAFSYKGIERLIQSEIYLPSTLKKVGNAAFSRMHRLNVYGLPENAEVGEDAFYNTFYNVETRSNFTKRDGMVYREYPDHISLIYCEPDGDTLVIPDMINGKPVTEIADDAFIENSTKRCEYGFDFPSLPENVSRIIIPEGVEVIGENAFSYEGIEHLIQSEVYLPSTLKKVGNAAFSRMHRLNVYGLPENAEVGEDAFWHSFYDVKTRSNYTKRDGMIYKEYPDHISLIYCEPDGDTLVIPEMINGKPVTEIADYAFVEKSPDVYDYGFDFPSLPENVSKIIIPEGVEVIGKNTFSYKGNERLIQSAVYLPSTLKKVGNAAFSRMHRLNVYGLPENAEVGEDAFWHSFYDVETRSNFTKRDGMVYTEYPDHITLYYCEPDGDTLVIPDMINGKPVTEIADDAFIENFTERYDYGFDFPSLPENVSKIVIPEGVKVGENAFAGTKFEGQFTTAPASDVMYGDANLDGKVTLADSLAILQFIANEDKYPLSEQAQKNADCYNPGDGITGNDAVAVMRLDTKTVSKLPIIEK